MSVANDVFDALIAAQKNNREQMPPVAMAGIGHFQSALTPAVFGGLSQEGTAADQPLGTTPLKLNGFDRLIPHLGDTGISPEGVLPDSANDEMIVLRKGVYMVNVIINATVSSGVGYVFEVYVDDQPTGLASGQDLSNQTSFLSAQISGLGIADAGSTISVYGTADTPASTFTMTSSLFYINLVR
jgi:hypothetical protein